MGKKSIKINRIVKIILIIIFIWVIPFLITSRLFYSFSQPSFLSFGPKKTSGSETFTISCEPLNTTHFFSGDTSFYTSDIIQKWNEKLFYILGKTLDLSEGEVCFYYQINESFYRGLDTSSFSGEIIVNSENKTLYLDEPTCYQIQKDENKYNLFWEGRFNYTIYAPPMTYNLSCLNEITQARSLLGEKLVIYSKPINFWLKIIAIWIGWWAVIWLITRIISLHLKALEIRLE